MRSDFAMFILTHGRANSVKTIRSLTKVGYKGRIVLVVDDQDKQLNEYKRLYGDMVEVFDKEEAAGYTDTCNNFGARNMVVFARNAAYRIAERIGIKYFMALDDDYTLFHYKYNEHLQFKNHAMPDINPVIDAMIDLVDNTPFLTVAMAQGGDFIGGPASRLGKAIQILPKAMNSFLCSTDKRIDFPGAINEDVNAYVLAAHRGTPMVTHSMPSLQQGVTQQHAGGLSDIYLDVGTYVKSFYSVMVSPSSVKIATVGPTNSRIHHLIDWKHTAVKVVHEKHRKGKPRKRVA